MRTALCVIATVSSATAGPHWTPRVDEEPIGECRKKFGMPGATPGG